MSNGQFPCQFGKAEIVADDQTDGYPLYCERGDSVSWSKEFFFRRISELSYVKFAVHIFDLPVVADDSLGNGVMALNRLREAETYIAIPFFC